MKVFGMADHLFCGKLPSTTAVTVKIFWTNSRQSDVRIKTTSGSGLPKQLGRHSSAIVMKTSSDVSYRFRYNCRRAME
jgi:hypothetical protein